MKYAEVVTKTAIQMDLLDGRGKLRRLDSLTLLDFVVALESASHLAIPSVYVREDTFESIESLAEMLAEIAAK